MCGHGSSHLLPSVMPQLMSSVPGVTTRSHFHGTGDDMQPPDITVSSVSFSCPSRVFSLFDIEVAFPMIRFFASPHQCLSWIQRSRVSNVFASQLRSVGHSPSNLRFPSSCTRRPMQVYLQGLRRGARHAQVEHASSNLDIREQFRVLCLRSCAVRLALRRGTVDVSVQPKQSAT